MQVSAAIMKCREQETAFRKFHDPVTDTVTDAVFRFVVAQSGFGEPDRADAAQDVFVKAGRTSGRICGKYVWL